MSELRNIRVRPAKMRDLGLFRKLWTQLLEAQARQGSLRDAKAMTLYELLFNQYLEQKLNGTVLFVADQGVLMWGDHGPLDVYKEKTVAAWGDFSNGNPSIKAALLEKAEEWAKDQGYVNVLYEIYGNAGVPEGYVELGRMLKKRL